MWLVTPNHSKRSRTRRQRTELGRTEGNGYLRPSRGGIVRTRSLLRKAGAEGEKVEITSQGNFVEETQVSTDRGMDRGGAHMQWGELSGKWEFHTYDGIVFSH